MIEYGCLITILGPEKIDRENIIPEPVSEVHKANHTLVSFSKT